MIDPADSNLTDVPGAVTFRDPARSTNAKGESWIEAATARFVPSDPNDLDAYDRVYAWCFDRFPRMVWIDEAGFVMPAHGTPNNPNRYLVQGAKRMLGHMACHTRPREINRNLIAQAQHLMVFDLPNPADRKHIAEIAGIPPDQMEDLMGQLGQYEFLWWRQLDRTLTVCPRLK